VKSPSLGNVWQVGREWGLAGRNEFVGDSGKSAGCMGLKVPIALISAATGFVNCMVRMIPKPNPTNASLYLTVGFVL